MQFRLLGPLEVVDDADRPLALGGRKQRSAAGRAAAERQRASCRQSASIDEVWGDAAPATVAKSIQVYVSRLRKELGDGRLVTRAPGYVLHVDAVRARPGPLSSALRRARRATPIPATAAATLREALALWRGPPLADLAYEPFAQARRSRGSRSCASARSSSASTPISPVGEHAQLVGEREALAAQHPLRERLREQLMLALYRSGRQADALAAYQAARRREAGRGARDRAGARAARSAPGDPRPGRGARRRRARRGARACRRAAGSSWAARASPRPSTTRLSDALGGRGRVLLIGGEPGIGKSRLIEEVAARARGREAQVLVGRCWEAGGAPVYWPWVQALRGSLHDGDLAELVPGREVAVLDTDGARFRLFEAVGAFLRQAAESQPLVVVLDDVHAADEPSLLLLRFVAREIAGSRLLIVGGFRDVDPTLSDPLTAALAELVREPHTSQIALDGLNENDVAEYIELAAATRPADELVAAIRAETEGNALFVAEVVRLLDAEGRLGETGVALRIPPSVRAVIGQRLGRLSPACRELLSSASVLGREFRLDALAQLSGLDRADMLDLLDEAASERAVVDVPGSPGRLRFAHALIRDTLYDDLARARRLGMHGRRRGARGRLRRRPRAAPRRARSPLRRRRPRGFAEPAIDYVRRAGDRALGQLAFEEAERHYETALALVGDAVTRCELLLALGEQAGPGTANGPRRPCTRPRSWPSATGCVSTSAALRSATGAGSSGTCRGTMRASCRSRAGPRGGQRGRQPDAGPAPRAARRRAVARREVPARAQGAPERGGARDGAAPGGRQRDPRLRDARLHPRPPLARPRTPAAGLASELIEVAGRAGDKERVFDGHEERFDALVELGDIQAARAELAAMARVARDLRQPSQAWLVGAHEALLALFAGSLEEAERLVDAARDLGERTQGWNATVTHRLQLYALRREQDRLGEIEDLIRRSVAEFPTYPIVRCVQTHVLGGAGRARRGARRPGDAHPRPLRRAALRRGVAREHLPARRRRRRPGCGEGLDRRSTSFWRLTTTTSPSATRR